MDHRTIGTLSTYSKIIKMLALTQAKRSSTHSEHVGNRIQPSPHAVSEELLGAMRSLELPKVELSYFDGDPVNFVKFIKEFEYHVEPKVNYPGQRLL